MNETAYNLEKIDT